MDLVSFNRDLIDQQPNIGLAQRRVIASQALNRVSGGTIKETAPARERCAGAVTEWRT